MAQRLMSQPVMAELDFSEEHKVDGPAQRLISKLGLKDLQK